MNIVAKRSSVVDLAAVRESKQLCGRAYGCIREHNVMIQRVATVQERMLTGGCCCTSSTTGSTCRMRFPPVSANSAVVFPEV